MKFQYCPNCAGISTMVMQPGGLKKCSRCNFVGEPKEGTAEEANSLSKRIKSGYGPATAGMAGMPSQQAKAPQKQDASSMATIKQSALKEQSDMKKIDLAVDERLKSLKGKKSDNFEFL